MNRPSRPRLPTVLVLGLVALAAAGCATSMPQLTPTPAPAPALPPAFPPQDIVGRWGLAAYHREEDRPRTEAAAAAQCKQPYIITLGPTGGVMMHLADQATPTELRLKGAAGNKTFIGPEGDAGGIQDREVVFFDGKTLILRWIDAEVQGRYGTMVYARCLPEGASKPKAKAKHKPKAKPKPKPEPKPIQPPIQRFTPPGQ